MIFLVDGDAFFCAAHTVFRPELRNTAICVLAANDGAIVSLTPQAAALGIPKFEAYFKVKHLLEKHNVNVFSSNFALYGEMSARVLATLTPFADEIFPYSVDESWLLVQDRNIDMTAYGQEMKRRVWEHVRIPVSVGGGPTKTIAKIASRAAKKIPAVNGCAVLDIPTKWEWVLKRCKTTDVWGVGKKLGARLEDIGIHTAYELAKADPKMIRKRSSVNLERTVEELNGQVAYEVDQEPVNKKQIYVTRSFGTKTSDLHSILEAVSGHAALVADKVRQQNHLAVAIHVFIQTSPFRGGFISATDIVQLDYPTNDTRDIVSLARKTAERLYRRGESKGHLYAKAGVGVVEMVDKRYYQYDLLTGGQSPHSDRLMKVLDEIKQTQGKSSIFLGAQGVTPKTEYRHDFPSPAYTSKWSDIPVIKC